MDNKHGLRQRQQQFQEQLDALEIELLTLEQRAKPSSPDYIQQQWQVLRVQYRIAELYQQNEEFSMAVVYFRKVLNSNADATEQLFGSSSASQGSTQESSVPVTSRTTEPRNKNEFAALTENVLNQLASLHFTLDDPAQAMNCLLDAKRSMRERQQQNSGDESTKRDIAMATMQLQQALHVNHAIFLHAKGNDEDATSVLNRVIHDTPTEVDSSDSARTRATALSCE